MSGGLPPDQIERNLHFAARDVSAAAARRSLSSASMSSESDAAAIDG